MFWFTDRKFKNPAIKLTSGTFQTAPNSLKPLQNGVIFISVRAPELVQFQIWFGDRIVLGEKPSPIYEVGELP